MQITEQWILTHAPSPTVAEDGRAISEKERYLTRCRTKDALTYWGECAGSARNPYYVSIDCALSEKDPTYSCSCPSRHFPCKHALALMYDILAGKAFDVGDAPAYVLRARARQAKENARAAARLERTRKYDAAVKEKKLAMQLDALDKAEKLADGLLANGLQTVFELPAQTLERMAAELGNCGLPAARDAFERIALLARQNRQTPYVRYGQDKMLRELVFLRVLTEKARRFLREQLSSESYALENPLLYEALGGEWNDDELREIGSYRKNARLVQLSFDVAYDEAKRGYRERGFWAELTRRDIVCTHSFHASRTLDYVGTDDTCFDLLEIPILYESPVSPYPRVWWDNAASTELSGEDLAAVLRCAEPRIANAAERAKARLSDPLLPDFVPVLIAVGSVGRVGETLVLADGADERIALRDRRDDGADRASVRRLAALPRAPETGDALFGLVFYDGLNRQLCLQPYSLVTPDEIVRLQY